MPDLFHQAARNGHVTREIVAKHLHVDRGRLPEVEDLRDDVRRLEEELDAREALRQQRAQRLYVVPGRAVAGLQRDQQLAVERADRARVAVRQVDAAHREAEVVDDRTELVGRHGFADHALDLVGEARGFLDPVAGRCAHVQPDVAGIGVREEIAAEHEHEAGRQHAEAEEAQRVEAAAHEQDAEQHDVPRAQPLERAVERVMDAGEARRRMVGTGVRLLRAEQQHRERRHQRARQHVRREHREHHGFRERHEQEARDARQEEHRHEHDADAQRRHERGHRDLARAFEDRVVQVRTEMEVPLDVLDRDGRVVDENADREREPAERHDVDGLAERGQRDQRREDRQRNRDRDDQRAAPVAEEQQDHHRGQHGGDQRLVDHALDGRVDEHRLVEQRRDREPLGQRRDHLRQQRLQVRHDLERRRVAAFQDRDEHAALAVLAHDVGLRREAVADRRHLAQVGRRAVDGLDRQVVDVGDGIGGRVRVDPVFGLAHLRGAGRQHEILRVDRVDDVGRREALREQRLRIEVDRDHAGAPAVRERDLRARHGDQLRAQEVERDVGKRLFAERLARQPELDHRNARRGIGDHERRRRALRHLPHDRLRGRDRLRDRRLHVRARLQEHLHDRDAGQRRRFDVLDVVDGRRQHPFMHGRDAVRHLRRGEAVVIPDHADHRDVDRGQHVDRCAHQRKRGGQHDHDGHHDERVGAPEREIDDPHGGGGTGGDRAAVKGTRMIGVGPARVTVAKLAESSG
ncbi:uncharacterized protein BCN122_II1464 [Burkholderia cenocepacia]|nr:uncharacterized protein BCN122_II1464 [Burkholderia cenocepacia]